MGEVAIELARDKAWENAAGLCMSSLPDLARQAGF